MYKDFQQPRMKTEKTKGSKTKVENFCFQPKGCWPKEQKTWTWVQPKDWLHKSNIDLILKVFILKLGMVTTENTPSRKVANSDQSSFAHNVWSIMIARCYLYILQDKRASIGGREFSTIWELSYLTTIFELSFK